MVIVCGFFGGDDFGFNCCSCNVGGCGGGGFCFSKIFDSNSTDDAGSSQLIAFAIAATNGRICTVDIGDFCFLLRDDLRDDDGDFDDDFDNDGLR